MLQLEVNKYCTNLTIR